MKLCEYGCGQEAKYQFKNGKWCCSETTNKCPAVRQKQSELMKGKIPHNKGKKTGPRSEETKRKISKSHKGKILSEEHKKSISESHKGKSLSKEHINNLMGRIVWNKDKVCNKETKKKISIGNKFSLRDYKENHPFLFVVEELRENKNGEIQVHCKNHECENSKEKGGWFTPNRNQLYERIRHLEHKDGNGGSYFYCSQHCKDTCPLYGLRSDPYKENNLPYTYEEYNTCKAVVFERENGLCEYCGEPATDMHHIFPVKLEPFFALDPDYCVACCEKHHYKYAHKDECSTGNLAKIVCSVESQKFLNQKIGDA